MLWSAVAAEPSWCRHIDRGLGQDMAREPPAPADLGAQGERSGLTRQRDGQLLAAVAVDAVAGADGDLGDAIGDGDAGDLARERLLIDVGVEQRAGPEHR